VKRGSILDRNRDFCVGFEVLTAVVMKSIIFWDVTPCSPLVASRALLATRFHAGLLLGLFFDPEDGGDMFPQNDN
jgi:hypothetical protein